MVPPSFEIPGSTTDDLYGHALAQKPLLWGHEIYNFGKPFLDHHHHYITTQNV